MASHAQTHLWPQDKAGDAEAALQRVFQSRVLNFKQYLFRTGN